MFAVAHFCKFFQALHRNNLVVIIKNNSESTSEAFHSIHTEAITAFTERHNTHTQSPFGVAIVQQNKICNQHTDKAQQQHSHYVSYKSPLVVAIVQQNKNYNQHTDKAQ